MEEIKYHIKDIRQARTLIKFVIFDIWEVEDENLIDIRSKLESVRYQLDIIEDKLSDILEK